MQSPKMNHILKKAYRIGKRDHMKPQRRKPGRFNKVILIMALAMLARVSA